MAHGRLKLIPAQPISLLGLKSRPGPAHGPYSQAQASTFQKCIHCMVLHMLNEAWSGAFQAYLGSGPDHSDNGQKF